MSDSKGVNQKDNQKIITVEDKQQEIANESIDKNSTINNFGKDLTSIANTRLKKGANSFQESLENGDSEGVRVVGQSGRAILKVNKSVSSKLKKTKNKKVLLKRFNFSENVLKTDIDSLKKKITSTKKELLKSNEKIEKTKTEITKLKNELAKKFSKEKSSKLKKLESSLEKDQGELKDKVEKLKNKEASLKLKNKSLKKLQKKRTATLKNKSFINKSLSVPTSVIKTGNNKLKNESEKSDSEGVKLATEAVARTAKVASKLKTTNKAVKSKDLLTKKQIKAIKKVNKSKSKLVNNKNLQKKNIKKKTYYSPANRKNIANKTSISISGMVDNVKNIVKKFLSKGINFKNAIGVKLAALGGGGLVALLPVFLIGALILTTVGILGAVTSPQYTEQATGSHSLSPSTERWRGEVEKQAKEQGMEEYISLILAIIEVETKGQGTPDIMQSSESQGLPMNSLKSEKESIKYGIAHIKNIVNILKSYNKGYEKNLKLIAQSYNFGVAFAHYTGKKNGDYSIEVAETYSKTVVAPSLGNSSGATYPYVNEVSTALGKPYLYWNGGNFMYGDLVAQYLGGGTGKGDLSILESTVGQQLNNGECYGLVAYYVEKQGGPQMMGSGFYYASEIGSDYDWQKYGWEVIFNPTKDQIKVGDIINWSGINALATSIYGHTGVVRGLEDNNNTILTYEQNAGKGRINAKYVRTYNMNPIKSVVRKK